MKTTIYVLIILVVCAFIGELEVSFNPFRIRLNAWQDLVGYILVFAGFLFMNFSAYGSGYKKGLKRGSEIVIEILKERPKQESKEKSDEHLPPRAEI